VTFALWRFLTQNNVSLNPSGVLRAELVEGEHPFSVYLNLSSPCLFASSAHLFHSTK